MKRLRILLVILILITASSVHAATYYIATAAGGGSDSNLGTIGSPWLTFAYAEAHVSDGDTVIVRGGTYTLGCTIDVPNTTWQAYPGETPIINGEWVRPGGGEYGKLVWITVSGVTWDGIDIYESSGINLYVGGVTARLANVTVTNTVLFDAYYFNLIVNKTSAFTITYCDLSYGQKFIADGATTDAGKYDECSSFILQHSYGATVRYNLVHHARRDGFIVDHDTYNSLVEYNQLYGNSAVQLYLCNAYNVTVRNNLIYGWWDAEDIIRSYRSRAGDGIIIGSEVAYNGISSGQNQIYNNTIAGCRTLISISGDSGSSPMPTNCRIFNNTLIEAQMAGLR